MEKIKEFVERAVSRRKFVVGAGAVAGATAALTITGCGGGSSSSPTPTPVTPTPVTPTDNDYLNYALNLEYLEAQYYLYAATGTGLIDADISAGASSSFTTVGTVTKGSAGVVAGMTAEEQQIVNEIAFEERAHVRFLRTALGANAVPMPNIDLSFFGPLATAAGITTSAGPAFNPFASFDDFLVGAFIFEDVGVTAYAGAAGLISSAGVAAGLLTAAAGILAVEAYHAGYVRTSLTGRAIAAGSAAAYPYLAAANKVEALRAMLTVGNSAAPSSAGSVETTLTLPMNITMPSAIVAADPDTAVGFSRTVNQVHHIVYGSATVGVGSGGFFPSGTNSIFATTTA